MTENQWRKLFKPIKNPIDKNASWGGEMFETYGAEMDFVTKKDRENPGTVWTIIEGDRDDFFICSGLHFVNRFGYLITKKPYTGKPMEIKSK